jgi:hypothetical protein
MKRIGPNLAVFVYLTKSGNAYYKVALKWLNGQISSLLPTRSFIFINS